LDLILVLSPLILKLGDLFAQLLLKSCQLLVLPLLLGESFFKFLDLVFIVLLRVGVVHGDVVDSGLLGQVLEHLKAFSDCADVLHDGCLHVV